MAKCVVVVPTYNESENIGKLVDQILALPVPDVEILIVDDNSPDGTGKLADELAVTRAGKVHVMHRAGKQGLGTAYIQGFCWALDHGADLILQMDADFSHDPIYIPAMIGTVAANDVVLGSRYVKGGRLDEEWSIFRKLLSWWANRVWVNVILRTPVKDSTGGFRVWKRETLVGMDLNRVRSNGYIFQVEMTYIATRLGYKFAEIPIYFKDRKYGTSKMGLRIQIEAALRVFQVYARFHHLTPADRAVGG
ncbi:MAG: polyprenol monophosphomannose synthase [Anaerolineae bacterium]|nr:polyprenol monophosphomannose synthase [Anaerolineae bacterium]